MAEPILRVSERIRMRAEAHLFLKSEEVSASDREENDVVILTAAEATAIATAKDRAVATPELRSGRAAAKFGKTAAAKAAETLTKKSKAKLGAPPAVSGKKRKTNNEKIKEDPATDNSKEDTEPESENEANSEGESKQVYEVEPESLASHKRVKKAVKANAMLLSPSKNAFAAAASKRAAVKAKATPRKKRADGTQRGKSKTTRAQRGPRQLESTFPEPQSLSDSDNSRDTQDPLELLQFTAKPAMPLDEWILKTIAAMHQGFAAAREHYNTPMSALIYWMPRIAPFDAACRIPGGFLNSWTIPVKDPGELWDTAPVLQHLRTDQVAHWLHISMQDLVGFLSLCNTTEVKALNQYLIFRLELMEAMHAMPICFQWLYTDQQPQRGDHVYELLLKLRSIDDEHQRLLTWTLHLSIQSRRNLRDFASFPRNSPHPFTHKVYRALFDYMHKAWSLFRAKTSPLLEWNARSLIPEFVDTRPVTRWYTIENPPMSSLTTQQLQQAIDSDMMFRATLERERNIYLQGDMLKDEIRHVTMDTREWFPHQYMDSPDQQPQQQLPGQAGLIRGPKVLDDMWWFSELDGIMKWHRTNASPEILQEEQSYLSSTGAYLRQFAGFNVQALREDPHLQQQQQQGHPE
ncbi:hypothetical protein EDD21DRAFT_414647 [Dissophora ornata]|nr:hypothetical protein EDD21DRAFT_414647 [Dissophora ornata]